MIMHADHEVEKVLKQEYAYLGQGPLRSRWLLTPYAEQIQGHYWGHYCLTWITLLSNENQVRVSLICLQSWRIYIIRRGAVADVDDQGIYVTFWPHLDHLARKIVARRKVHDATPQDKNILPYLVPFPAFFYSISRSTLSFRLISLISR